MTAPLYESGVLGEPASLLVALAIGIVFGWFLERGGLGNARKLMGQFYLTDFTVFKVLFTALVTAMLGVFWLAWLGVLDLSLVYVPETYWIAQLTGGVVFGVGFALGGLCPGTSCVAASTGRRDGLLVIVGMLAGVFAFHELYPALRPVYEGGALGPVTLPQTLPLSYGAVVLCVTAAALLGFSVAERLERRGTISEPVLTAGAAVLARE